MRQREGSICSLAADKTRPFFKHDTPTLVKDTSLEAMSVKSQKYCCKFSTQTITITLTLNPTLTLIQGLIRSKWRLCDRGVSCSRCVLYVVWLGRITIRGNRLQCFEWIGLDVCYDQSKHVRWRSSSSCSTRLRKQRFHTSHPFAALFHLPAVEASWARCLSINHALSTDCEYIVNWI